MKISIERVTPRLLFGDLKCGDMFTTTKSEYLYVKVSESTFNAVTIGSGSRQSFQSKAEILKITSIQAEV